MEPSNETIGTCQFCGNTFNPENYLIVDKTMTLPEHNQTYYTICPDCEYKTDMWISPDSIEFIGYVHDA